MQEAKLLAAGLLAVAATASMAQETAFSVKGIAPDGVGVMYLSAFGGGAADSSIVPGKGFAFEGKAQKDALLTLTDGHRGWHVFNDGTPVDVDLNRMTIKASPLNERLFAINLQLDSLNAIGMGLYADYERVAADASGAGRRRKAELLRQFSALAGSFDSLAMMHIRANRDNLIPVPLISIMARSFDYQTLRSVLDPAAPYYGHPALEKARALLDDRGRTLGNRRPGLQFADIELPDTAGVARKLSEWCGKGGYVLVDFWASWCGPCRMEMPNVVENYRKYRAKGFNVVGISLDSDASAWRKAIGSLQMEWPQLSDLKGWKSAAAALYSVNSIPASILIDGSGKIVDADLRGPRLGERLREIYGEL